MNEQYGKGAAEFADHPVGIGLVGFGSAGRQHVQALADADFALLRGVLDANPAVQVPDGVVRHDSWPDLLADPGIDVVALCTPPGGRALLAREALEAGKTSSHLACSVVCRCGDR